MLLLLAIESPRLSPGAACTLHLLLTLSDRFIMALSTKPPRPLVGEGGLLEEPQPGNAAVDDSVPLLSLAEISVGANLGVDSGLDCTGVVAFVCTVDEGPSSDRGTAVPEMCTGTCGFANAPTRPEDFSGSADGSRDMPGSLMLRLNELSTSLSLSLRLYAADPTPLSAVCRKKVGSFDPNDLAIWLRDGASSGSPLGRSAELNGAGDPRKGCGRVEFESLDDGLCCQERVPLLASKVAVGGVGAGVLELFCGGVGNVWLEDVSGKSLEKQWE